MSKVTISANTYSIISDTVSETLQAIRDKIDDWQETYDERESNEPEYDSQIDRWQEALDRLEEKIEAALEITEYYEAWIDDFKSAYCQQTGNASATFEIDDEGIIKVISELEDFNFQYRGLAPIIKKMKNIPYFIKMEN